jgi:signal transduction histidine kinase
LPGSRPPWSDQSRHAYGVLRRQKSIEQGIEPDAPLPIVLNVIARAPWIPAKLLRAGRVAEDALPVGLGVVIAILYLAPGIPTLPGGGVGKLAVAAALLLLAVRQTIVLRQRNGAVFDAREGHAAAEHALADNRRLSAELQARIDEMRALEPRLIEASKQKAVADLATSVAHQVNNPLTSVRGYAELLLAELPPGDAGRADLETIRAEALRASDIVKALLELAHGLPHGTATTEPDET